MTTPMVACRSFNTITIDRDYVVLHKASHERQRLRDEHDWYAALPPTLRDLTPAVRGWVDDGVVAELSLEFVPLPSLASLYLGHAIGPDAWWEMLSNLLDVHARLSAHRMPVSRGDVLSMYVDKTFDRLSLLASSNEHWGSVLALKTISCNGVELRGVTSLRRAIVRRAKQLASRVRGSVIHGDFCLSNILYDVERQAFLLVDPRGRFGRPGLAGDPRYDIAKLRHSVVGGYDSITSDRFVLDGDMKEFVARVEHSDTHSSMAGMFDKLITGPDYDFEGIRFIEALLFLSMPPLHNDSAKRQLMMFLTGLTLLNEVLP